MAESVPLPGPIAESVEDYLAECRARDLSASTLAVYGHPLRRIWLPWCAEHGLERLDQVDQRAVTRFAADLLQRTGRDGKLLTAHTRRAYASAVAHWLRWAHEEHGLAPVRIGRARLVRQIRPIVTEEEVGRMAQASGNARDRLIVNVLWLTGMRASELLGLRVGDLVRHDGRWFLRLLAPSHGGGAKGSRERLVPFPQARELRAYLAGPRLHLDAASDHVFLSSRRGPLGERDPLSLDGLEKVVRTLGVAAGVPRRVHPHMFRRSAITHWLRQGMSPMEAATIVGHSSLKMILDVYSALDVRDGHDALARILLKPRRGREPTSRV